MSFGTFWESCVAKNLEEREGGEEQARVRGSGNGGWAGPLGMVMILMMFGL